MFWNMVASFWTHFMCFFYMKLVVATRHEVHVVPFHIGDCGKPTATTYSTVYSSAATEVLLKILLS